MDKQRKESNGLVWYEWTREDGVLCVELTGEGFLTDEETAKLKAEFIDVDSFEVLGNGDTNVYAPHQESVFDMFGDEKTEEEGLAERLFLVFRKGVFTPEECEGAYIGLKGAARPSKNRGVAGGKVDPTRFGRDVARVIPVGDGTRAKYVTKDGLISDTVEANMTMGGIAGFFPPTARNPYVRKTAYTRDNWDKFKQAWPFLRRCTELFEELHPDRYQTQREFVEQHELDKREWVVPGTVYSTITVNKNFQTACHQDAGDFKAGLENFSVLEAGEHTYKGGYTVFPQFRVAFDCRQGDFVGMDVAHHFHGNTPIEPAVEGEENYERISLVMYLREDLAGAGTQEEEFAKYQKWRAKHRSPQEQHAYRKKKHLSEQAKDASFMDDFGVE